MGVSSCHTPTGVDTVCAESVGYHTVCTASVADEVAGRFYVQPSCGCAWPAFPINGKLGHPSLGPWVVDTICTASIVQGPLSIPTKMR